MSATVPLIGLLCTGLLVVFPGWGIKQLLARRGWRWQQDPGAALLTSFSLGVHLAAFVFLVAWTFVDAMNDPLTVAAAIVVPLLAIGAAGLAFRAPARAEPGLPTLLIVGIAIGGYAAFHGPSVLDSVQILQVQQYLLGWEGGVAHWPTAWSRLQHALTGGLMIPAQPGFAGLAFVPALLQSQLPVVTVASGLKVVSVALAAVIARFAAQRFGFRPRGFAAALIFAGIVFSHFGLYGIFETSKDSIFAVLMLTAAIVATFAASDGDHEPGLFLSAAILLGAIAVPFGLVFVVILFVASGGARARYALRQAAWALVPLAISVVAVRALTGANDGVGLITAVAGGALAIGIAAIVLRRIDFTTSRVPRYWPGAVAVVPAAFIVATALLFPAQAFVISAYNGTVPVYAPSAPLDGITTASGFFYRVFPTNNPWMSTLALAICAILPIASARHRSPYFIALFSFLPATTLIALVHLHLHLHVLSDFNLWDITKDTIQWYVGALDGIVVLIGAAALGAAVPKLRPPFIALFVGVVFLIGLGMTYRHFVAVFHRSNTVTLSGAFHDASTAKAMDYVWREGRGRDVQVTPDSELGAYFFAYQMFGSRPTSFLSDASLAASTGAVVYLTDARDARRVIDFAKTKHASIKAIGLDPGAFIVDVRFDQRNAYSATAMPIASVDARTGVYAVEQSHGRSFRWIDSAATLDVVAFSPGGEGKVPADVCFDLLLTNPWKDESADIAIDAGAGEREVSVPADATLAKPATTRVCATLINGSATVHLRSNHPARRFSRSGDGRQVAFGLGWPIAVE